MRFLIYKNKTYYYIFRSIDVHKNISNPTYVYQVTLRDDGGAVYPEIEVLYNFENMQDFAGSNSNSNNLNNLNNLKESSG